MTLDEGWQQGLHQRNAQAAQRCRGDQAAAAMQGPAQRAGGSDDGDAQRDAARHAQTALQLRTRQRTHAHGEHGHGGQQARVGIADARTGLDAVEQGADGGQDGAQVQAQQDDGGHQQGGRERGGGVGA